MKVKEPIRKNFDQWCIDSIKELKLEDDYDFSITLLSVFINRPDILSRVDPAECKIIFKGRFGEDKFFTLQEFLDDFKRRTTISTTPFKNFDFLDNMSEEERTKWHQDNQIVFDLPGTKEYEMSSLVYSIIGVI